MPYVNGSWMDPAEYASYMQGPRNLAERRLEAERHIRLAEDGYGEGLSWILVQDTWAPFTTPQIRRFLTRAKKGVEETLDMGADHLSYEDAERQALWLSEQEEIIEILKSALAERE